MFVRNESGLKLALFDIDETLLSFNSMRSFISFFFTHYYGDSLGLKKLEDYQLKINGMINSYSREVMNKFYYTNYAGIDKSVLDEISKKWFEINVENNEEAFNRSILNLLEKHKRSRFKIVLVSGGFFATVNHLVKHLSVDDYLYVTPTVVGGVLTGEIEGVQTIGSGKSRAVLEYFQNDEIDWGMSYAYGDHISDLPMLRLVGNPVAVGTNPQLLEIAGEKKWKIIL